MLTVAEVAAILAKEKKLVRRPPQWKKKINHNVVGFLQYHSALEMDGVIQEDLFLSGAWRAGDGVKPERFCLAILACNDRVYAWDVDSAQQHINNNAGVGRPFFGKRIKGPHEHTWSDEGYGYVEPLTLLSYDVCKVWDAFLLAAKIVPEPCVDPDAGRVAGGYLDLGIE